MFSDRFDFSRRCKKSTPKVLFIISMITDHEAYDALALITFGATGLKLKILIQ
jgi:hypothetical protein